MNKYIFPNKNIDFQYDEHFLNVINTMLKKICAKFNFSSKLSLIKIIKSIDDLNYIQKKKLYSPDIIYKIMHTYKYVTQDIEISENELNQLFNILAFQFFIKNISISNVEEHINSLENIIYVDDIKVTLNNKISENIEFNFNDNNINLSINTTFERLKKISNTNIILDNSPHWIKNYISSIKKDVDSMLNIKNISISDNDLIKLIETNILEGLQLIKDSWPEMYEEVNFYIKQIVILDPPMSSSFSDINCHGCTFFINNNNSPVWWAENIVHECSHMKLNTILASETHLNNPYTYTDKVPWRQDSRPLIGVLHGTYVYSRMYLLLKKIYSYQSNDYILNRMNEVYNELKIGIKLLEDKGDFTNRALLNEIKSIKSDY
ncbi:aKG-HExxH-type peptide beta-hydroxylase [Staphylococcus haemolyticus]|uniref:aKG-HExxH-type peptide beta-hydroxylase n=1 Tax=Staphylococcus haemolyticus TaxID=1283 RepID=UPI0034DD4E4B